MSTWREEPAREDAVDTAVFARAVDPESAPLCDRSLEILTAAGCRTTSAVSTQTALVLLFLSSPRTLPREPVVEDFGPPILGCGPGMPQWPVEVRCRLLRWGVKRFLDTDDPEFHSRLIGSAEALTGDYLRQRRQGEQLRSVMERMGLVGLSPAFLALVRTVIRVAPLSDIPVLITGETGTGKELFARAVHQQDPARATRPMVALNCAAVPLNLLESELFGYRRGSFTGADRDRAGLLRSADRSVLFLDEVGELPLEVQAKFLRAIQSGEFIPLGDDRACKVNVRIVAATNQPIERLVSQGKFREDLFHRLNVVRLRIPPLRERKEDIAPLVDHFFRQHRRPNIERIEPDLLHALAQSRFPGNVRQLENIIRWALVNKADSSPLDLADCPPEVWAELEDTARPVAPAANAQDSWVETMLARHHGNLAAALEECERTMIETVLSQRKGNQSEAARHLGITPRSVYNKLRKYGLTA